MKSRILLLLSGLLCTSCAKLGFRGDPVGLNMRENVEWCDIRHNDATKDDRPRVLLVGDSIVGGYAWQLNKLLEGTAYSSKYATSRCLGDPVLEQELEMVLGQYTYDIIHFNNGLHGAAFSDEQYERALDRVFKQLARLDAQVIWRDSTGVNPSVGDDAMRARVERRNGIARRYAANYGFKTDNLGVFEAGDFKDKLHYTPEAQNRQAEHVADLLMKELKR